MVCAYIFVDESSTYASLQAKERGRRRVDVVLTTTITTAHPNASFYQSFSTPAAVPRSGSSTHSSPASVNLPSPSMPPILSPDSSQDPSPRMAPGTYNFSSPLSPAHLPSPHRYEFDYGVQPSVLSQSNLHQWEGNNNEQQMFSPASADPSLYNNSFGTYGPFDTYGNYDTSDLSTMTGLSTTPPLSSFAASGLPFRGLDYIRNYNPSGYITGDQDSLWQSYDPGAFGYDPDIPFTLGDIHQDAHDTSHH